MQMPDADICRIAHASKFLKEKTGLGPLRPTEFGKGEQSVSQISQTRNGTWEDAERSLGGLGDGWTGKGLEVGS